jgi:hypothetical protein
VFECAATTHAQSVANANSAHCTDPLDNTDISPLIHSKFHGYPDCHTDYSAHPNIC